MRQVSHRCRGLVVEAISSVIQTRGRPSWVGLSAKISEKSCFDVASKSVSR